MSRRQASTPSSSHRQGGPPALRRQNQAAKPKPRATWREIVRAVRRPTIGRLRRDLSHYLIYGLFLFVFIFLAGALFSFGSAPTRQDEGQSFPLVARVGNTKLTREEFEQLQARVGLLERGTLVYRYSQIGSMLDRWIDEQLLSRLAHQRHLKVAGGDVQAKVDELVQQRIDAERGDVSEKMWRYRLQQKGSSADEVTGQYRDEILANEDDLRSSLLLDKVREDVQNEVEVTDDDLHNKYDTVTAHVILIRASVRKPMAPPEGVTETEDELKRRQQQEEDYRRALDECKPKAEQVLARVKAAPAKFEAIARTDSDDYTKDQGGLLPAFTREAARFGDGFKEAVFKLEAGKLSDLIATDDGWVICRVDSKQTWPDMFKTADPRTFDAAKKLAEQVRHQIVDQHADFATLARDKSEDPGSGKEGGDLGGLTERGQWVKPFEKVAFALDVNEVSQPVRTQFGYHLIQCLEREPAKPGETFPEDEPKTDEEKAELKDLPIPSHPDLAPARRVRIRHILFRAEDPDQKVEDKRQELTDQLQSEHFNEVLKKLREEGFKSGLIQVAGPEAKAYLASKDFKQEDELYWLRRAADAWPESHPEVHYELAQQYLRLGGYQTSQKPQVAAAQALTALGDDNVVADLMHGLDSLYPEVRKAAVNALGQLKAKEAVDRLTALVSGDTDSGVVEAAKRALESITGAKPAEGGAAKPKAEAEPVPAEAPPTKSN